MVSIQTLEKTMDSCLADMLTKEVHTGTAKQKLPKDGCAVQQSSGGQVNRAEDLAGGRVHCWNKSGKCEEPSDKHTFLDPAAAPE